MYWDILKHASFYISQEMNIEKQKYQELLEKYQGSNKDHETMVNLIH